MQVTHLNEFLVRAKEKGILLSVLFDFRKSGYHMGSGMLRVYDAYSDSLDFVDDQGRDFNWGLSKHSGSAEITGVYSTSKIVGNVKVVVCLGRMCSGQGELS